MTDATFDAAAALADFNAAGRALGSRALGSAPKRRFARRPNHSPVRRDSHPLEAADGFYRPISFRERATIVDQVTRWSAEQRKGGIEPLTASAKHILRTMLLDLWRFGEEGERGVFDWALSYIAARARRSKQTVVHALQQLARAGVVEWIRRCEPNDDPDGPAFVQATNAYRFLLPVKVREWVEARQAASAARKRARTVPEDQEHREAEQAKRAASDGWCGERAYRDKLRREAAIKSARNAKGPGVADLHRRLGIT